MPTNTCYVLTDGNKDMNDMNRADTLIAESGQLSYPGKVGGELWADFEVIIKEASQNP